MRAKSFQVFVSRFGQCFTLPSSGSITNDNEVYISAVFTIVALKVCGVVRKAAAVNGALLSQKIWWRNWRRHDGGFGFAWKQTELLAADVEASGTDERAPPGRTWTGCNGPSHWRSWRGAWGRWTAPRLQWKVIWDKKKSKVSNDPRDRDTNWWLNTWRRRLLVQRGWSAATKQEPRIWKQDHHKL